MDILKYIPVGHENAVTRRDLCRRTRLSDRKVRQLIEDARKDVVILNLGDSKGYFVPAPGEEKLVLRCKRKEMSRYKAIYQNIIAMNQYLSIDDKKDIPGQESIFDII